jgi:hypothetical protein
MSGWLNIEGFDFFSNPRFFLKTGGFGLGGLHGALNLTEKTRCRTARPSKCNLVEEYQFPRQKPG